MKKPIRELLSWMDSLELTKWQVFLTWRAAEQRRLAKEREFMGPDDDEVIHW